MASNVLRMNDKSVRGEAVAGANKNVKKTAEARKVAERTERASTEKVTVKPEPEKVIKIISLGTEEKPVNKKKEGEGSTKKTKPTLSSVETAGREEEEEQKKMCAI
ncbi:hypothetical protein NC653_026621 [Populus alba x Populus x berolinensis]|uniref:Uncharacterized protein n=1 Tax=Populus alba x Populus x berolinensis TaxID=444605 RepID=A0AAD6Q9D7_9ROSI|nr:hypothetical protein NC653_026621 [Populus alba x Populus x berolinensis]